MLSIGSGIGFIEKRIYELSKKINITAIEPSIEINRFRLPNKIDFRNGFFPNIVKGERFDFAYACFIDYCFNKEQYYKFVHDIYEFDITCFMLASIADGKKTPLIFIKDLSKHILAQINLYNRGQFWGYLRTMQEHKKVFADVGFKKIQFGNHSKSKLKWILAMR